MTQRTVCPGCGSIRLSGSFSLSRQPVVLNYRFRTAAEARGVARRDIRLAQCRGCGLVFNAVFDPAVVPYDQNYENRQNFSPAFVRYLNRLADSLRERHGLSGGRILEVGCGKGDFLRMLCRNAGATGVGFDTSFEAPEGPEQKGVRFERRYLSPSIVPGEFQLVICRHVVEHVADIGAFLRDLRAIAVAAGDPVVMLETPRWEWIVRNLCLWDISYEHCNYFHSRTLMHLCRLAGFRKVRHRMTFGGQYQVIELRVDPTVNPPTRAPGIPSGGDLRVFSRRAQAHLARLTARFRRAAGTRGWAIWGAGAKGVALANQIGGPAPSLVVDSNPAKQGGVLPGTRIPIVSPADPRVPELGLIVIANPNYGAEIRRSLRLADFRGAIETL